MYPGNAPFPLAFGIPNTEPLSYHATGLGTLDISSSVVPEQPQENNYYQPQPRKELEYTVDHPRLSKKQRQFYEKNGFLVIPKLVPEDLIDHCTQRFLDLVDGKVPKGN